MHRLYARQSHETVSQIVGIGFVRVTVALARRYANGPEFQKVTLMKVEMVQNLLMLMVVSVGLAANFASAQADEPEPNVAMTSKGQRLLRR